LLVEDQAVDSMVQGVELEDIFHPFQASLLAAGPLRNQRFQHLLAWRMHLLLAQEGLEQP